MKPRTIIGLTLLLSFLSLAILVPIFSSHAYDAIDLTLINLPPTNTFFFGTDDLGRDIFTRVFQGMRISFLVALTAGIVDLTIGITVGCIAAFFGRKTDEIVMRICDILYSIPYLLNVILLMMLFRPSLFTILVAISFSGWVNMARVVRTQILEIKEKEFIQGAIALGLPRMQVLLRHLLPNSIGAIIGALSLTLPYAIFAEAFLSFLGLGLQPPAASLGVLISDGLAALRFYPWRLFFPAGVLSILILSFNLVADSVRDAMDPRL